MESLQHWPWETNTVDKVDVPKESELSAGDGGQALHRPEGQC